MMKLWIVAIGIALACAVGCSKTFMCHLNGTSCPASPQSPSNESSSSSESSEATPEESTSSQNSEPQSEAKSEEAPPAKTNCRPSGATCDQSYQCCSDACVTHSPDDYCR